MTFLRIEWRRGRSLEGRSLEGRVWGRRPEAGEPEPEAGRSDQTSEINTIRLNVIPEARDPAGSPESQRFTPFGAGHKPIRNRCSLRLGLGRSQPVVVNIRYNNCISRRIKTIVCLRRLHDTGSCFTNCNPLAAGRAGFRPANRRRFHRN